MAFSTWGVSLLRSSRSRVNHALKLGPLSIRAVDPDYRHPGVYSAGIGDKVSLDQLYPEALIMPRRIRYQVAASLDGYIAGPNGEFDWIVADPEIDFGELFSQFDTFLMGRGTFETMVRQQGSGAIPGKKVIVFSRTLRQEDHPEVAIVAEPSKKFLNELRDEPGKDIWIFGGGLLFRSLLEMRMVDTVEIAVMPVLVGGGIPLLPPPAPRTKLKLTGHHVRTTGIVSLHYSIEYTAPRKVTKEKRPARSKS